MYSAESPDMQTEKYMGPWDWKFIRLAYYISAWSKDPSTKVGCIIVGPDHEIRSTGYNGLPRGVSDLPERMERPQKYLWTSHAEENAIAHAARIGVSLKECTVYVTHIPCARCARALIQAGITKIYAGIAKTHMDSDEFIIAAEMFKEAKVTLHRVMIWR